MLKAIELRIGNLIKIGGNTLDTYQTFTPTKVTLAILNEIAGENKERPDAELSVFQPIPITEEWLMKAGFEEKQINNGFIKQYFHDCTPPKYRNNYGLFFRFGEMRNESYKMYWYASDPVNSSMHSFPCRYVHQLQNLYFAITGQELTFKK